ncbi:MAG: lipopolysaccharide heptosyltransferase II [Sedimentisphaerales bacterium]|nr:lipopolysaccharide heptosyltransferase II [Sedimentisphaerales bacterium]
MGDAILCTPALRAIRRHFESARITFLANPVVQQVLSPSRLNDHWFLPKTICPFATAGALRKEKFTEVVLFKNSFGSALVAFLAGIPVRIGYARECRGPLLTDRLYPPKLPNGDFKPVSMIDYYLALAGWLGCDTDNRTLELSIDPQQNESLHQKLPELAQTKGPVVIMVPGGTFGPSKCWPAENFAKTADKLIEKYNAMIVISVSDDPAEKTIARKICEASSNNLVNLAEKPLTLAQLKSLFSTAELVITNDTGPRHIATALHRKVVTLFGPNDPVWTDTGYENEIQIVGNAPCVPCARPKCTQPEHICMESITVDMVCDATKKLLENHAKPYSEAKQNFIEMSKVFFVDSDYETTFRELGLTSLDAVFSFNTGRSLSKDNLASYRNRLQFDVDIPERPTTTLFLKRYDCPPLLAQLKNCLSYRQIIPLALSDFNTTEKLSAANINVPKVIAYGCQKGFFLEKRSFIITEKIPDAESLEKKLPEYFDAPPTSENLKLRENFIKQLAKFIKKFHQTGFRHRDLYLCHIFHANTGQFYLIDLARAFKPLLFTNRFKIKDIAQLHYSAPAKYFSKTDRMHFYLAYTDRNKLNAKDKKTIAKVKRKAQRMAKHDQKHGRNAPFKT